MAKKLEKEYLEGVLRWAELPYKKMPIPLPDFLLELAETGYIDLKDKKITVFDVYCLVILATALVKGDTDLFEQLAGKASTRQDKGAEKLKDVIPDQEKAKKLFDKYKIREEESQEEIMEVQ